MKSLFTLFFALFLACSLHAQAPKPPAAPAPAATADDLNLEQMMERLYSEAATAFNQQKFDVALQSIGVIHQKTANKAFEKVMFLEGACLYNIQEFEKAAEILAKFVETYPTSEQIYDAKMAYGRALMKKPDTVNKGIIELKQVASKSPKLKLEAGLEIANYYMQNEKMDEALNILKIITTDGPNSQEAIMAIIMKAQVYLAKAETENAQGALDELRKGSAADDSIVQINNLSLKIGHDLMGRNSFAQALLAFQNVRRRNEIIAKQKVRIARIEQWQQMIADKKPVFYLGRQQSKEELDALQTTNKTVLEEIEKNTDYDAALYYSLAQCFWEMKRYYEAKLAFQRIYEEFKEFPDRHRALFGMVACDQQLGLTGRAAKNCEKYMADYPDGPNIGDITSMYGSLMYQSGNVTDAISAIKRAMSAKGVAAEAKESLGFMLGGMLFEAQKFEDCRLESISFVQEFKASAFKDVVEYRIALSYFFENKSREAITAFKKYVNDYPQGQYFVDAKYRLAFILYQAANTGQGGNMAEAMDILEKLVQDYPVDDNIGQVYALLGDIYSSKQETKKALDSYRNAVDKAKSEDVLNYAIDNATNLMSSENMWAEISSMWATYYSTRKDGPLALKAIYWISRAKQREGKLDDAYQLIGQAVAPHIGNPAKEDVEVLIQQMVTMMAPKKARVNRAKAATAPAPAVVPADGKPAEEKPATDPAAAPKPDDAKPADAKPDDAKPAETKPDDAKPADAKPADGAASVVAAAAAPGATTTFAEQEERIKKYLAPEGDKSVVNGTAAARVLYARALLARVYKDAAKYDNLISIIPDAAKVEELSPLLLSTLAEMLMKKGDGEKAAAYFARLRDTYGTSEFADKAPVGLGDIEYGKKNYEEALKLYEEAITKSSGSSSMLDATLGKARCYVMMKKYDEAEKIFLMVAQVKEWASARAEAFYFLGQIAEGKKEWEKALSFYNRDILSQQKYKPWLAKSYLQAAKCLGELGRKEDATKVLQEMMTKKKDLQEFPEFKSGEELLLKSVN
jgi:tetratricopeptide (TPR) repeat protein